MLRSMSRMALRRRFFCAGVIIIAFATLLRADTPFFLLTFLFSVVLLFVLLTVLLFVFLLRTGIGPPLLVGNNAVAICLTVQYKFCNHNIGKNVLEKIGSVLFRSKIEQPTVPCWQGSVSG